MLFRVGIVLNIHKALRVLHGSEQEALAWLATPHQAAPFRGQAPMDLVTSGSQDIW
ncbi:antitoxin Xre/MbcA/ParS toxin-binding domain-containing protein [Sabulicella glaciei]|uniref:MbcA/ParS/Xre antitoxin family protein n=1 Tax=Sabulicella glaciei TaxID=2984948 RepID=A0ABT3NZL1_9PROT|nr:antitoxin Xre/MbcA/ParS toxin-binding domain-containing protein [Roseococcus sp. MDT2-1-1]MCW8087602.1 MbcA/ParS/Xre antitoxin family protein [Roseococcus sp. MDT2-1-1]